MPGTIPPIFPSSKPSSGGMGLPKPVAKTSVFSDQYKQASSSINRVMNEQHEAVSSISRVGKDGSNQATTSIARKQQMEARSSIYGSSETDEQRDERRYQYIRNIIRAKQKKEQEAAKHAEAAASHTQSSSHIQKGGSFSKYKFHKKMRSFFTANKASYKNISTEDQKVLENIISTKASRKAVGKDFTGRDKREMRAAASKAKYQGKISGEDMKDFKKIIDTLE